MTRNQAESLRLRMRAEGQAITARAVDGYRDLIPADASAISRWATGDCMSPIGWALLMIAVLPEPRAAIIVSGNEDAYDAHHGEPAVMSLAEALLKADLSDSAEDNARALVAIRGASDDTLRSLIASTYEQDRDSGILRRVARRELYGRGGGPMRAPARRRSTARAS